MTTFRLRHGSIWMEGSNPPVRLSEESVEELLDIFLREGATRPFLDLHEAHLANGGIERVSNLRELS